MIGHNKTIMKKIKIMFKSSKEYPKDLTRIYPTIVLNEYFFTREWSKILPTINRSVMNLKELHIRNCTVRVGNELFELATNLETLKIMDSSFKFDLKNHTRLKSFSLKSLEDTIWSSCEVIDFLASQKNLEVLVLRNFYGN